jgi:hypothetical protein
MRRAIAILALMMAPACGGAEPDGVVRATMALSGASLDATNVKSVGVTVVGGAGASCPRALALAHPIDDPTLEIVAHALFVLDGAPGRPPPSLRVPSGRPLVFYAEAFRSPDGERPRIGRGCAEATLNGPHADITVAITDGS